MPVFINPFTGDPVFIPPSAQGNGFGIIQPPNGTSPTAGQADDALNLTSSDGSVTITGTASTKTVNFQAAAGFGRPFVQTVTTTGSITYPAGKHDVITYISGTSAPVTGALQAGSSDGDRWMLIGSSNTNTVTLPNGANQIMNGDYILAQASVVTLMWSASLAEWLEVSRNGL